MTVATDILAEGKTKTLRPTSQPDELRVAFKDAATAFNGKKYQEMPGKGALNARISALLFELLAAQGIPTCFVRAGSEPTELIYKRLTMIPLEVVVRNFAYGSIVKRFGFDEGMPFNKPLVEFFHKTSDDPQITEDLILELNLVPTAATLEAIKRLTLQINEIFVAFFEARGIRCGDFKLEFGLDPDGTLLLGDELSPDNFRLRDAQSGAVLDKDVFRLDLADLVETYQGLLARMEQPAPVSVSVPSAKLKTYQAEVWVHSRKSILNPESKAILEGIHTLGYGNVQALGAGKRFTLKVAAASLVEAEQTLNQLAQTVLSNPVIEDYELKFKN
ncbi:phosphoribosylformylglycinamidine synthase subunit PurS [Vampirovibrio sp.]|uniref:phosphoribosylformylglycinamidine synthase subunit PurS n=1 Tax=Vampirovibrio sp. TaxID=2717857 RepID=UPI003593EEE2